ncbi:hypothetical protein Ddc_14098 [Ditylenchus destructor]|nr:hypothetical protein Ddc_14098 [Ditylenchus destructor]
MYKALTNVTALMEWMPQPTHIFFIICLLLTIGKWIVGFALLGLLAGTSGLTTMWALDQLRDLFEKIVEIACAIWQVIKKCSKCCKKKQKKSVNSPLNPDN